MRAFGANQKKLQQLVTTSINYHLFLRFGDDNLVVGSWETKEIISREGDMKLQAQVFFASIDQRSERVGGESACTVLADVIANWLQSHQYELPTKSAFDDLVRDGSLEWRNLCENEEYRQKFPDKHFDFETIIEAQICPLSIVTEKSFIGFFQPEGLEDFLHGAMTFDSIWDEINQMGSDVSTNSQSLVYILSWNDHFFVLRVDPDVCYIIDTLGERLYEGCNKAYILKFDKDTSISRLPAKSKVQPSKRRKLRLKRKAKEESVCKGKEACKEFIRSFLAGTSVREMQADINRGLMAIPIHHHRLQIEFHYTQLTHSAIESS
ncbi:uncharacterized protein [Euphorbia lathyris]|uniref:uncharacterized protein n=1 Tax=Euphorbia lathyris TaxID=212925 RepID=UPI00331387ED